MKNITKESLENCKEFHLNESNELRYSDSVKKYGLEETEAGVSVELIGINKDGDLLAVSNWDWNVFKIKNAEFEKIGKLNRSLNTIKKNPKILLEEAKVMTLEDIEKQLGHKIIVKEKSGFYL